MSEIAKVLEDMRMADSLRNKLHFLSPVLVAAASLAPKLLASARVVGAVKARATASALA